MSGRPDATRLQTARALFIVFGGPAAWLAQLCIGSAMASWPCFPGPERLAAPLAGYGWTAGLAIVLLFVATAVAAAAAALAWGRYRQSARASGAGVAGGRNRFLTLWGTIMGTGFAAATLVTLLAFAWVPRCGG